MNTENSLHLFTDVEDGLPEKEGLYPCILKNNNIVVLLWNNKRFWITGHEFHVTHWLDLSKLTTRKKAEELAIHCYNAGRVGEKEGLSASEHGSNFINENKDRL